jgi:hypothetical protein
LQGGNWIWADNIIYPMLFIIRLPVFFPSVRVNKKTKARNDFGFLSASAT